MNDPVRPAVASFDPMEWTKKIDILEQDITHLRKENVALKKDVAFKAVEAANAIGAMKPVKDQVKQLKETIEKNDNIKENARLRAEVAAMHKTATEKEKDRGALVASLEAKIADLSRRTSKAEGQFKALESTASMLATARDKATSAAATLLTERDQCAKRVDELGVKLTEVEREVKALRAAAATKAKA